MSEWPKRPDGTNKTMGEMTREERREQFRLAGQRFKRQVESPAGQRHLAELIGDGSRR